MHVVLRLDSGIPARAYGATASALIGVNSQGERDTLERSRDTGPDHANALLCSRFVPLSTRIVRGRELENSPSP